MNADTQFNPTLIRALRRISEWAAAPVIAIGCVVLVGWTVNSETIKSVVPGLVPMNPWTAVSFILSGAALLILRAQPRQRTQRQVGRGLAIAVAVAGAACFVTSLADSAYGLDLLLFHNRLGVYRMAPNTALAFVLAGSALALLDFGSRKTQLACQLLALATGSMALLALIGYAYSATPLYGVGSYIPMALNTAVTFAALAAGILCVHPAHGLMARIVSTGTGGITARRLLPAAILLPALLGWLRIMGEQMGLYGSLFGMSLNVVSTIAILSLLVWWTAGSLNRTDRQRRRAEVKLHHAKELAEAAREIAEAANRIKGSFLANMSHEIRTPLNAVIGMTELLLRTKLSAEQREYLAMVHESGESLLNVINDILDFSKIEAGKLDLDPVVFNLRESLGDGMKTLAFRAHSKGLELACHIRPDVPDGIVADQGRLRQIVVNLVGNAIKFTDAGEVVVEVGLDSRAADDAVLHFGIRDTGIGIAAEKLSAIFGAFEQADISTTRKFGGTGLGLAISQKLVELMHGRIWVESAVGQGSTFHFTACCGLAKGNLPPPRHENRGRLRGMRVLAVDDNATNRLILDEILRSWDMRPSVAAGADEALRLMHSAHDAGDPFSLVLTDANMPEVDGFELAERIKPDQDLRGAIIMMVSSGDGSRDIHRCEESGIAAYLMKPIKQSELFDAIVASMKLNLADEIPAEQIKGRIHGVQSLRVLLAEDSLVNRKLAVALLEQAGHRVATAENGQQALDAVKSQAIDLVLMDVQMPIMDGLAATREIRAWEKQTGKHIPILAMTAHAMKGDRERCLDAGMDGYVAKPIRVAELFDGIEKLFPIEAPASNGKPAADVETCAATIDRQAALKRCGGSPELMQELAATCRKECDELLIRAQAAIAAGDAAQLARAAHTLKGAVGIFDPGTTFEAARKLEEIGRGGDLSAAAATCESFQRAWQSLDKALQAIAAEEVSQK